MYTLVVVIMTLSGPAIATVPGIPSHEACLAARTLWIESIGQIDFEDGRRFGRPAAVCIPTEGQVSIEDIARRHLKEFLDAPILELDATVEHLVAP